MVLRGKSTMVHVLALCCESRGLIVPALKALDFKDLVQGTRSPLRNGASLADFSSPNGLLHPDGLD